MEGLPLARGPRTALRDSQRLKSSTASFTKEKRAEARRFAEQGRQMRGELKELEAWFVDHGHLSKDWRDSSNRLGVEVWVVTATKGDSSQSKYLKAYPL